MRKILKLIEERDSSVFVKAATAASVSDTRHLA
jgi:hypothetical protein